MPIYVIDKIKQKNNGDFKLVDAVDVEVNGKDLATTLNEKIDITEKGKKNGVASLDSEGKVPAEQLPSYVNEIVEGKLDNEKQFTGSDGVVYNSTNSEGKIFVDTTTNKTYRWSGTKFSQVGGGGDLVLGTTKTNAWYGDRGLATETLANELSTSKQDKLSDQQITNINDVPNKADATALASKQDTLVSGVNVKTINNESIIGKGNITIGGGGAVNGVLWEEIISDELLGTWVFKDTLDIKNTITFNIGFSSNILDFTEIILTNEPAPPGLPSLCSMYYNGERAYELPNWEWTNEAYRTIEITDTSKLTNRSEFETWLKANATKQ